MTNWLDKLRTGIQVAAGVLRGGPAEGLRQYINSLYARYGTMTRLTIDPKTKRIEVESLLQGEQQPIAVTVGQYHLVERGEGPAIVIDEISISRAWMELLAREHLVGKTFPLPSAARLVL